MYLNMSIVESLGPTVATLGGGFFVGVLIGYALKKMIKLVAVIIGLFLARLAYLLYHQIANSSYYVSSDLYTCSLVRKLSLSKLSIL